MAATFRRPPRALAGVRDDFYDMVHAIGSGPFWRTVGLMVVGIGLYSIGVNALLVPHHFISTGATGLSLLAYYALGWPSVGVILWCINLPILFIGWRAMSLKFVVMAIIGVFISGLAIQLTREVRLDVADPMMAAVLAGVLTGGGCGLYLRFGGSAGGIDIVAAVMRRKYAVPMGTTFLAVNAINFLVGGLLARSLEASFYTAVAMFTHARVLDRMQASLSSRKAALIVTSRADAVSDAILRHLGRGVTLLDGSGGMSQRPVKVVYTVVNLVELARLKEIIFHLDEAAFVSISDASEVIGKRFVSWASQGFEGGPRAAAGSG